MFKLISKLYVVHTKYISTTLNQQSHDLFIISDEHMLHIHTIHILYYLHMYFSVRAMQSMLDMNVNTKIPDDLVHKLPFK